MGFLFSIRYVNILVLFVYLCKITYKMAKYKVLKELYKLSEEKSYNIGSEIELTEIEAERLIKDKTVEAIHKPIKKK